jgi:hypothetical protein
VVKQTTAASGYDDISLARLADDEQGLVGDGRRVAMFSTPATTTRWRQPRQAADLRQRARSTRRTRRRFVGPVSGFDTYKSDYTYRLTAAAGVTVTVNGANQFYTPKATSTAGHG